MNKVDIKNMLISMRTAYNESIVNNVLGKIDLMPEEKFQSIIKQYGNDEEKIKKRLEDLTKKHEPHISINKMFSYGTSEGSIHLHMPVDLQQMMSELGLSKTIDTVNLYLLDAIEKIRQMKKDGFYKFEGKDNIYMISPILLGREIKFLNALDFKTNKYKKKELQDEHFVAKNPEAQLAIKVFGKDKNVGTATIGLDTINSKEWQEKRARQVELYKEKGITLDDEKVGEKEKF